jgi:hypothetical protein
MKKLVYRMALLRMLQVSGAPEILIPICVQMDLKVVQIGL